MHVLIVLSAFLLGRTSYCGYKRSVGLRGIEENSAASTLSPPNGPFRPVIRSRAELFNLPTLESNEITDHNGNSQSSHLPDGLQRYEPTSLKSIPETENVENGIIEEVDQFRFVVAKEEFQRAMASRTAMKVKQRNQAGLVDNTREFYIDPSILVSPEDTLNSDAIPTQFNLDMEYAAFRNSVSGTSGEVGSSNEAAQEQERIRTGVSSAYDPIKMLVAEEFVRSRISGAGHVATTHTFQRNSEKSAKAMMASQRRDANLNVFKSLALTSRREIVSDIIGVLATMIAAFGIFAAYEVILQYMAKTMAVWSVTVSRNVRLIPVPTVLRRNNVAVFAASSVVLVCVLATIWKYRRDRNPYSWVGYS